MKAHPRPSFLLVSPSTSNQQELVFSPKMASESTPLLDSTNKTKKTAFFSPIRRILLVSLFLSLSFSFTQTPLFYAMKLMTCDAYHQGSEGGLTGGGDRCSLGIVESNTAKNIALMSSITTASSLVNLFLTGYLIRTYGVKFAFAQQTFWSCIRNVCQITALSIGGSTGIQMFQYTQLINGRGRRNLFSLRCSMLALNAFIAVLSSPEERTSQFGVLQGIAMLGTGLGYSLGGLVSDHFGIPSPFKVTLGLLISSTLFASIFLPYIAPPTPTKRVDGGAEKKEGAFVFLSPLKLLGPNYKAEGGWRGRWGLGLLGLGLFCGVLATGFVPLMLQLVGTNLFDFLPTDAGLMMSANSLIRAFFLVVLFPRIIKGGRHFLSSPPSLPPSSPSQPSSTPLPVEASEFDPPHIPDEVFEPVAAPKPTTLSHGSAFDLHFLRISLILDGLITSAVALSTKGSHIYIVACILPFASGAAPAGKGVVMEMVEEEDRADALSAIALVERLAQVTTIGVFGALFAELSEQGRPTAVFFVNGATALVAASILLFVRIPPAKHIVLA
ncbi:hypothetical protein BDY24DRAFT_335414 [Mrakia frigida]|uniref:uncharacterized protein n=1 Tax=Mrakia frigida TaxID=29902 RepID=UPI003FCBF675